MQSSSLSTYIGYITGPRADQPVGVRVVEPPPGTRQHQRGSLYTVIEVIGDHPDRAAIVERLLSEAQRVYYSAKGSQSQVIVEAVQQTQQLLREINAHTPHYPMQLGITSAALLGGKLLVASSGPAFALMRVSERVHMFPSEPNMSAVGYGNMPIEVYRQDVSADDALFLGGGGWLRRVPTRTLASIIAFTNADNCTDAADELFDQAGQMQVPGLLIVLGAGSSAEPPRPSGYGGYGSGGGYPSAPGGGGSGGSSRPVPPRRPRFGGLPTALNTAPPARLPPSSPLPQQQPPAWPAESLSSGPPEALSGVQPRGSRPVWEQPQSEPPAPRAAPEMEPPPPSLSRPKTQATVDESMVDESMVDEPTVDASSSPARPDPTQPNPTRNSETINNEIAAEANLTVEPTTPEPALRHVIDAPYPVSPLEEQSFGGDLPVEPDQDFDPIFPPSTAQEGVHRPPRQPGWLEQWQAQAGQRMGQARAFLGRMLPESRQSDAGAEWQEISDVPVAPPKAVRRYNELEAESNAAPLQASPMSASPVPVSSMRASSRRSARPLDETDTEDEADGDALPLVVPFAPTINTSPFAPPAPARGARARLFLLIALIIVVLVPAVVLAINFGQGNTRRAEAEQLTARAEIILLGAQSALDQGDKVTARERLTEAQDYLAQAIELDGTNEHRAQLIATIELELQQVLQIIPLYGLTEPLIAFPPDARPQHVLVMNDDIFVIDSGRQALLQYRYDPATEMVSDQLGQVVLSQGDQIDGVTVGALADLAWLPLIPGFEDRPSLLITDRNNNVFRYDQRVEGATVMPFADRATWGSIGQVQTYNGRIYVADETGGSLLRYEPGRFEAAGEPWFLPETPVNLDGLISMEIDGDIWLLFDSGMILRYREGQQVAFSPESSIGLAEEPTDMYVTRQESAFIYLVDAGQDRILVYDKSGAYIGQLRAPEGDLLRGLASLYVDEVGGVMYILTQTGLFAHPVLP